MTLSSCSPQPSPSRRGAGCRAREKQATAADQDPALSEPKPRDSLSPQRGEGRGEGCDRLRPFLELGAPCFREASKGTTGTALSGEHRTSNIELPTLNLRAAPRPSIRAPRPSFDSLPRPSPRSRRRGSAGWALRWIGLPAAFVGASAIDGKHVPEGGIPRACSRLQSPNRSSRRESALISLPGKWSGLTSAATGFVERGPG
jgi:hypothetical protein